MKLSVANSGSVRPPINEEEEKSISKIQKDIDILEAMKQIVEKRFITKYRGIYIDLHTASLFFKVYNSLTDKNKKKLLAVGEDKGIGRMIRVVLKVYEKGD